MLVIVDTITSNIMYLYSESDNIANRTLFSDPTTSQLHHQFLLQKTMESLPKESRIILALEALKKDSKLSIRKATTIYKIPKSSLYNRHTGKNPRCELPANSRKLTDLEEKVLLKRVLDLNT